MNYLLIAAYLGILGFIVYRQFSTQKVRPAGLLVFPALLAFGAVQALGRASFGPVDLAVLGVGALAGLGTGLWRGQTYRIWTDQASQAWLKGTWMTLASWGVLLALRILVAVGASLLGVHASQLGGELLGSLFATFAAQNAVIWLRTRPQQIIRASAAS